MKFESNEISLDFWNTSDKNSTTELLIVSVIKFLSFFIQYILHQFLSTLKFEADI